MASKTFSGIDGKINSADVNADYESSERFDNVRVGKLGVFFRDFPKIRFLAYDLLERVFIRVNEVNLKTC
ncbi:MAG: hypothetical protein Q4E35_07300 [Eubacteriales bacterium]|nr:hypothetical protein [Eubacteriales bacterium]